MPSVLRSLAVQGRLHPWRIRYSLVGFKTYRPKGNELRPERTTRRDKGQGDGGRWGWWVGKRTLCRVRARRGRVLASHWYRYLVCLQSPLRDSACPSYVSLRPSRSLSSAHISRHLTPRTCSEPPSAALPPPPTSPPSLPLIFQHQQTNPHRPTARP